MTEFKFIFNMRNRMCNVMTNEKMDKNHGSVSEGAVVLNHIKNTPCILFTRKSLFINIIVVVDVFYLL